MAESFQEATPTPRAPRGRKLLFVALLLQCIPLLGAAGCLSSAGSERAIGDWVLLWFFASFWGLGYLYLGRMIRFLVLFLVGPALAFGACLTSYSGVQYDFEHQSGSAEELAEGRRAAAQTALIISGAVLLILVDTWRLTALHNAELDAAAGQIAVQPLPQTDDPG